MNVRLIIAGTRSFHDYDLVSETMKNIRTDNPGTTFTIISGGANGADALGERYAKRNGLDLEQYPANWQRVKDVDGNVTFDKAAGFKRNEHMASLATHCLVFWDGVSRGTAHMISTAHKAKLRVRVIKYNHDAADIIKF